MRSYQEAKNVIGNRESKKLANNTYLVHVQDPDRPSIGKVDLAVRLHNTYIVIFRQDGKVVLNSGGWQTLTTRDRMNRYIPEPWRISQTQGIWYVTGYGHPENKNRVYQDGMYFELEPCGTYVPKNLAEGPEDTRYQRKLIRAYADAFVKAFVAGEVKAPNGGDCWYCLMKTQDEGKPLGEATGNKDHINQHIEEHYYVPSLLARAVEVKSHLAMKWAVGEVWWPNSEQKNRLIDREHIQKDLKNCIRRYIYEQFGMVR